MFKIALDAGHGLNTAGKRCDKAFDPNETREWFLNDRICDKVEKKLSAYSGYSLIRVDDTTGKSDVSLADRVKKANDFGADIYLSVHQNAAQKPISGGGAMAIIDTTASQKSKEYQKIIYDDFIRHTGLKGNRTDPTPAQNLYVCKHTKMPAVLVECGFMNSSTDTPIIITEDFAEKSANALVESLVDIGKLTKKETAQEGFTDIKGHYAEAHIKDLASMGIVSGRTKDKFMPDATITRGEVAVIARNVIKYITGK